MKNAMALPPLPHPPAKPLAAMMGWDQRSFRGEREYMLKLTSTDDVLVVKERTPVEGRDKGGSGDTHKESNQHQPRVPLDGPSQGGRNGSRNQNTGHCGRWIRALSVNSL